MDERLRTLEERFSHQQVLLETLDEVVRAFVKRVELLERKLEEIQAGGAGFDVGPASEPPPHY